MYIIAGHIECVHLLEGHSVDDDDSSLSDGDDDHAHPDPRMKGDEEKRADPNQEHEMSMAEAFVSMYSDSTSDTEFNDDDDLT